MSKDNTPPTKPRKESVIQAKLITRCRRAETVHPEFFWVYSYPAGFTLGYTTTPSGRSFSPQAMKAKAMGLKAALPDIVIDVARGPYRKGWIELKREGEKPRKEQQAMHEALRGKGDWVGWYDNLEDAWIFLCGYLGVPVSCHLPTAEQLPQRMDWEEIERAR